VLVCGYQPVGAFASRGQSGEFDCSDLPTKLCDVSAETRARRTPSFEPTIRTTPRGPKSLVLSPNSKPLTFTTAVTAPMSFPLKRTLRANGTENCLVTRPTSGRPMTSAVDLSAAWT
jgi:hypothetical protein